MNFRFPIKVNIDMDSYSFQAREVNTLLGDVIKHMLPDRAFEEHYESVGRILNYPSRLSDQF